MVLIYRNLQTCRDQFIIIYNCWLESPYIVGRIPSSSMYQEWWIKNIIKSFLLLPTKLSFAFVFQLPGIWLGLRLLKLIEYDWSSRSGQTQLWTHHYLSISPFGNPCLFCKEAQTALWSVSSRKNVNLNNKFSWAPSHQPARVLLPMWKRNLGNESSNPVLSLMTNELSK